MNKHYLYVAWKLLYTRKLFYWYKRVLCSAMWDCVHPNLVLHSAESGNKPWHRKQSIRPIRISQQLLDPSPSSKSHQLSKCIDYREGPSTEVTKSSRNRHLISIVPFRQPSLSNMRAKARAICHLSFLMCSQGPHSKYAQLCIVKMFSLHNPCMYSFSAPVRVAAGSAIKTINPLRETERQTERDRRKKNDHQFTRRGNAIYTLIFKNIAWYLWKRRHVHALLIPLNLILVNE